MKWIKNTHRDRSSDGNSFPGSQKHFSVGTEMARGSLERKKEKTPWKTPVHGV
jgi:hypothetical protein